ncbi:MAG: carboxypeptidase M32 [Flavobacteriales bacterium]|nr:carboxypeptidase M32 [Flavobacteriales bacterium]MCB9173906.1 carboxypeptidase M32 [Flavobacteriales bacterium]
MNTYQDYKNHLSKIADVEYAISVLNWDQEVFMPEKGSKHRAQQISTLSGIAHDLSTNETFGKLVLKLSKEKLPELEQLNIKESLKNYERNNKYTTAFVQQMSKTISEAFIAWQEAKQKSDFSIFAPKLKALVKLKREECELLGYKNHPYNAQLDLYEPGATVEDLDILFNDVKKELVPFVQKIANAKQNDEGLMFNYFNKDKQLAYTEELLAQMGYDFKAGRQDISSHPFTTNFGPLDVRVTTRVDENNLNEIMWSSIHEGGHALYEQGLLEENYGLPAGSYLSLGIHESQSRLWENNVGRSSAYWNHNFKRLQEVFPENLAKYTSEDFYKAMNIVKPSLIRTSADELTYHFHVLIRYEIEKELIAGAIEVDDLPKIWNKKYKDYLNIDVPNDAKGVLQDIHWSHGSFGYFPTYSIGSFYAAQFFNQAKKEIKGIENQIENGDLIPLLNWLREKIHIHGRLFAANELCEKITGEKLNFKHFLDYAKNKYNKLYQLK